MTDILICSRCGGEQGVREEFGLCDDCMDKLGISKELDDKCLADIHPETEEPSGYREGTIDVEVIYG